MLMLAPHRRRLVLLWVALAILISVIVQGSSPDYTNFTRPGTESQHASDLLTKRFPSQTTSGWTSAGAHRDPPGQVLAEEMGG